MEGEKDHVVKCREMIAEGAMISVLCESVVH